MDLIAGNGHRKWTDGWPRPGWAAIVAAAWLLLGTGAEAKPARPGDLFGHEPPRLRGSAPAPKIPLPTPRPAEAPAAEPERPAAATPDGRSGRPAEQAGPAAPVPPQPSACRAALTEEIAIAPSIPDIHGAGGCGGTDLVKLEAIVLPDGHRVAV